MNKAPTTAVDLHPLVSQRWSPRSLDEQATIDDHDVTALLEAARWAPSANNSQPWRLAVVKREDREFATVVSGLAGFNREWAPRASAFLVVGAESLDEEGRERKWAEYDTGIAAGLVTMQAHALGWHVHQMGGFSPDSIRDALGFNERTRIMTVIAVGRLAAADKLSDELRTREESARQRKDLSDIVVYGLPATVAAAK